jgi:hypothetical protein
LLWKKAIRKTRGAQSHGIDPLTTYEQEEHLNMLEGGIIAKLLDEKWSTYAQVHLK